MAQVQWVNLSKDKVFTNDGDGSTVDRCGKLTIEAMFLKDDTPIMYKVKVTPVGNDNVVYNKKELKRNPKFKLTKGTMGLSDKKNVLLEETIQLPAAGGNKYKIEAKDANGKVVSTSIEIETKRKLYYQTISMDNRKGSSVPSYSLAPMEKHSNKHHIKIIKKGAEKKIPYTKTIMMQRQGNNLVDFGKEVKKTFKLKPKLMQLGLAAVFSEYIASKSDYYFKQFVTIGTANPRCSWNNSELMIAGDRWLWHGMDNNEDKLKHWFAGGFILFTDLKNGIVETYSIDRKDVDILGNKNFSHGGYSQIKITLNSKLKSILGHKQGQLAVSIKVRTVDGWTNGFSWNYGGIDLITCARRTMWTDMPVNTREYTWNHEIGHRFGMTAWGSSKHGDITRRNKLPDGPSTLYGENRGVNDKSHSGPHCEKGATYNATTKRWSGTPGCVMFGANGIGNKHSPNDYCSECVPIVRKLDLSP